MKEIRSNFVKESLLDYESLANTLKENTTQAVRDLLGEAVRETYNQILSEEDENDYEIEDEVDDTATDAENDAETAEDTKEADVETVEADEESVEDETEATDFEDGAEVEDETEDEGWAEFEKYKVSDDEYDFSEANDDEIVKVYKLLKDEDQVHVNVDKDTKKVEIKDDETGAEYLLDLSSFGGSKSEQENDVDFGDEANSDLEIENENMNESRLFEIVLNEYDSHVGYTDNYQKKDVMTNPGTKEPGKKVNDWDAGVPKSGKKPWAGKGSTKPFAKKVNEEEVVEELDEANLTVTTWNDPHAAHNRKPAAKLNAFDRGGIQKTSKGGEYRPHSTSKVSESKMMDKVEKILKENEQLKSALNKFKSVLEEAAVTNINLGQIIKLISENSTTKEEKQEIIARFGKEAKTVEQSKSLYESISRDLKKNNTMNINEDKQFTTNGSKMINETQIYQSQDLMESLDLMHRLCKK